MRGTTTPSTFWLSIALLSLSFFSCDALFGATCTSVGNGNWNSASTWSCGHVPTGGDSVIVAVGDTVTMSQNHVYNGAPLEVQIYGVWYFIGGGSKITLPCGSHVEIMDGGLLLPNSNSGGHSETVRICGVTYWYYDEGPVSGYELWPPIILPIELIFFEASASDSDVRLEWLTGSEIDVASFELRSSRDGFDWSHVANVAPQGASGTVAHYVQIDKDQQPGLWYYVLREVGTDGSYGTPAIRSVQVGARQLKMLCTPNPVTDGNLTTILELPYDGIEMSIVGTVSRMVSEPDILVEAEGVVVLDVADLTPGYYVAVASLNGANMGTCTFSIMR